MLFFHRWAQNCSSEDVSPKAKKNAALGFSETSLGCLLDTVEARRDVQYPCSGCNRSNNLTTLAWEAVAVVVSANAAQKRLAIHCRKRMKDFICVARFCDLQTKYFRRFDLFPEVPP
ncbi:uncharacterized protein LOC121289302 isoform X3 [Carcharodon carcharias]|uniref:uncharacterized protein LOC121289302 isoform X3 n=1 Tax=Carcharodon carcharias TaxID=13397 RepID=UPI001B7E2BC4|nr:uncharacterized protein LOC121289302 isoform X3 [Carcharodon carcharias]